MRNSCWVLGAYVIGIIVGYVMCMFLGVARVTMSDVKRAQRNCTIVDKIWRYGFSCIEPKDVLNDDYIN